MVEKRPPTRSDPGDGMMDTTRARKRRRSVLADRECLVPASKIGRTVQPQTRLGDLFTSTLNPQASMALKTKTAFLKDSPAPPGSKKPRNTKAPAKSSTSARNCRAPPSEKSYTDALKAIDKVYRQWLKKYKPNAGPTADDVSASFAHQFLPVAKALMHDSPVLAFNLVLDVGEHAYGDIDYGAKSSGYGDTEEPFKAMDQLLEDIIQARLEQHPAVMGAEEPFVIDPATNDMGTSHDEFLELLGPKGIRNKKQAMERIALRRADQDLLIERRRSRRMHAVDWVGNALNDLCETRERIEAWGIGRHYFAGSIGRLCKIKGVDMPQLKYW